MRELAIPPDVAWELLIVNNNSTDGTNEVIDRYAQTFPIRKLFERRPGQCHARNCACDAARGDLIVWTDDDVLVPSGWIEAYVTAAREFPEAGFFGGPIFPEFETDPPRWVRENMDMLSAPYAALHLGEFTGEIPPGRSPYGANMAFRRKALGSRRFDTRIGYTAGSLVGGDETSFIRAMAEEGISGVWVGNASVHHFIPRKKMTPQYLWKYHEGVGRSQSVVGGLPVGRRIMGYPGWALRQFFKHRLAAAFWAGIDSRRWIVHYSASANAYGVLCTL
jgi:glycosyltransferase involved in cell wall biosynthesis